MRVGVGAGRVGLLVARRGRVLIAGRVGGGVGVPHCAVAPMREGGRRGEVGERPWPWEGPQ